MDAEPKKVDIAPGPKLDEPVRKTSTTEKMLGINVSYSSMMRSSLESESFLVNRDYRYLNTSRWIKVAFALLGFVATVFTSLTLNCTPYFDHKYPGMNFVFYSAFMIRLPSSFILPILVGLKKARYSQQLKYSVVVLAICFMLCIFASIKWPESTKGFMIVMGLYAIAATANMSLSVSIPRILNYYHSATVPWYYSPGPLAVIVGSLLGLALLEESVPFSSYITVFATFCIIAYITMIVVLVLLQKSPYFDKNELIHLVADDNSLNAYVRAAEDISGQFWDMLWLNLIVGVTIKSAIFTMHPSFVSKQTWTLAMIMLGLSCESIGKGLGRPAVVVKILSVTSWYPWLYTFVIMGFFFLADQAIITEWYLVIVVFFALVEFRYGLGITQYVTQVNTAKIGDPNAVMMVNLGKELGLLGGAAIGIGLLWLREWLK